MGLGYLIFFLISFFMWQNLKKGTELFQSFCFSSVVSVLLLALHVLARSSGHNRCIMLAITALSRTACLRLHVVSFCDAFVKPLFIICNTSNVLLTAWL